MVQLVADIVEANGKTVRENNQEQQHSIAIGSLVEITYQNSGLRLYVVQHSRDCDGSPLYNMSYDLEVMEKIAALKKEERDYTDYKALYQKILGQYEGAILRHYGEASLQVIKTPQEVREDYQE